MFKANGTIINRRPAKHGNAVDFQEAPVCLFPFNRWLSYLLLIPASIAEVLITAFFVYTFFAVLLILGLWIWWLRWQLHQSHGVEGLEGEYVVIKETCIVETKTDKDGINDSPPYLNKINRV